MRPNSFSCRNYVFPPVLLLLVCLGAVDTMFAQQAARLTQPIDDHARVTLPGTVHPLANARNDRGPASPDMPLERLQIILKRSPQQEASLQQLLRDMHTPGSANFHKWLTPDQFGQQFGPSDQDVQTIEDWLQTEGFQILKVNAGISYHYSQIRGQWPAALRQRG
jgi:hypothetical protein